MRAGSGLCAGQESVLNAVPEGGSAGGLTATIGPGMVVRWVPGGPGPCLNFLSAEVLAYENEEEVLVVSRPPFRGRGCCASSVRLQCNYYAHFPLHQHPRPSCVVC